MVKKRSLEKFYSLKTIDSIIQLESEFIDKDHGRPLNRGGPTCGPGRARALPHLKKKKKLIQYILYI